jgi:hypothetical protein
MVGDEVGGVGLLHYRLSRRLRRAEAVAALPLLVRAFYVDIFSLGAIKGISNAPMGIARILMAIRKKRWSFGFKTRWSERTSRFGYG